MEQLNKLSLPATILIGCIILGGFYYAAETNKQASIERQQQVDLQAKQAEQQAETAKQNLITAEKASCVANAQSTATAEYKNAFCSGTYQSPECSNGTYLVAQYDTAYRTCLQSYGIQ